VSAFPPALLVRTRAHVHHYGLTIPAVLARVLGPDMPARTARAILDTCVRQKTLFRHHKRTALYYTSTARGLTPRELYKGFAVLWFSSIENPAHPLLPPNAPLFARVVDTARALGIGYMPPARAYVDGSRLALLHVCSPAPPNRVPDLARTLADLQRFVAKREFRPWLALARDDRLVLTCLHAPASSAAELDRWIARHPLVAPIAGTRAASLAPTGALVVPARVFPLNVLRGTT
jgi:hypothetical protein